METVAQNNEKNDDSTIICKEIQYKDKVLVPQDTILA